MFDTRTRLSFFACQKDAAGSGLTNAAQAPALGSTLKVAAPGGSGFATLLLGSMVQKRTK